MTSRQIDIHDRRNLTDLIRREWGMAVGRHDQDPRPS